MKHSIKFGDDTITYSITKSRRRKTSAIIISDDEIEVRTPFAKTDSEIRKMVLGKMGWIVKKQLEFADRQITHAKVEPRTVQYLEEHVWAMASKMNLKPSKVMVKSLKTRWGSCTKTGVITINAVLCKAPQSVVNYVIVHELCHLRFPDHSWRFWNLVSRHCKNYEQQVKWLGSSSKTIL